jgi:hypothetical protein
VHATVIARISERVLKVTPRPDDRPFDGTARVGHDSVVRRGEPPVEPNPLPPLAPEFESVGSDHRFSIVEPKHWSRSRAERVTCARETRDQKE